MKITPEIAEQINEIYYQCKNKSQTAKQIGCSAATISRYILKDYDVYLEMMEPYAMNFVFLELSFKPAFSFFSFTLIKRLLFPLCFLLLEWCHLHI